MGTYKTGAGTLGKRTRWTLNGLLDRDLALQDATAWVRAAPILEKLREKEAQLLTELLAEAAK